MNIEIVESTFHPIEVYRITLAFFSDRVKAANISGALTKPILFDFYELSISEPIDKLKDSCDDARIGFLEVVLIMSWALYRVWVKAAINEGQGVAAIDHLDEQSVIHLFLENLDCDEGRSLLEKVNKAHA